MEFDGGRVVTIDTTSILDNCDLESLGQEGVNVVRRNMKNCQAFVQLKNFSIGLFQPFCIYRIIVGIDGSEELQ